MNSQVSTFPALSVAVTTTVRFPSVKPVPGSFEDVLLTGLHLLTFYFYGELKSTNITSTVGSSDCYSVIPFSEASPRGSFEDVMLTGLYIYIYIYSPLTSTVNLQVPTFPALSVAVTTTV